MCVISFPGLGHLFRFCLCSVPLSRSDPNPNFPGDPRDEGVSHVDSAFTGLLEVGP
jgi:hypothetical protein